LNGEEKWGNRARNDPLVEFFLDLFEKENLDKIEPITLTITLTNNQYGEEFISKHLDEFPVKEPFLAHINGYKLVVAPNGVTNQSKIII
jgi:hypothetical protein